MFVYVLYKNKPAITIFHTLHSISYCCLTLQHGKHQTRVRLQLLSCNPLSFQSGVSVQDATVLSLAWPSSMDDFLPPEEVRSDQGFFSPIGKRKSRLERVKKRMYCAFAVYIKDYMKRNGLLTLSMLGVITGCVLGCALRGYELSSQVCWRIKITYVQYLFSSDEL